MRSRGSRKVASLATAAVIALIVGAVPAGADTQLFDDPAGDADTRADILNYGASYGDGAIAVAAWVAEPTDPFTDPNWTQSQYTYVRFGIDAEDNGDLDYLVFLYTLTDGSPFAEVRDWQGNDVCPATPTFDAGFYAVDFEASCIGSPSRFSMNAYVFYDTDVNDPAAPVVEDSAPDGVDRDTGGGSVSDAITSEATDSIEESEQVERVAGIDRIATAVAVSESGFGGQDAGAVVLATAFNYPDALVGVPLAKHHGAPMLLTRAERLDPAVAAEIQRVLPSGGTVYLLGGTGVLSPAVESELSSLGYRPVRLAGPTRYHTAVAVAEHIGSPSRILLATGQTFHDALIAGATAAAFNGVLVLTEGSTMPQVTRDYINANGATTRIAVGNPASAADPGAKPIQGANPSETSVRVAAEFFGSGFYSGHGFGLASSANFPDALSGGARVAIFGGPMLLTERDALSERVRNYLQNNAHNYSFGYAFGGTAAIGDAAIAAAQNAIAG